tara:strand:- start:322 stop:1659 length:1338 start_codon:yes stop_codon:yes gene_type:complete
MIIKNKNITVIGAGISGIGASSLAYYKGANVLLSNNEKFNNDSLINNKIKREYSHSDKCINSDLVIVSPGIKSKNNSTIKKLESKNISIISEIEFASRFTKSPIIAVTGSNGKSTVVKLLYHIFKNKYKNVFLGGNIGISFSMNVYNELKNNLKNSIHIIEVSSFQLERVYSLKPYISCILNVIEDHLDRHGDFENYLKQKIKLIKNHTEKSFIVYNQDDKNLKRILENKINSYPYSLNNKNTFYINKKSIYCSKTNKEIINQEKTQLVGKHNLSNILACIEICRLFNFEIEDIIDSLKNFKPLNHRMEVVYRKDNFIIINDSKGTNLDSTKSAIGSFDNKIILLLGGFSNQELNKEKIIDTTKSKNIHKIICFGKIGENIHKILTEYKSSIYIKNFESAILKSIEYSLNKKSILFSPGFKSYDEFKNFEERGNMFKKIIHNYYA